MEEEGGLLRTIGRELLPEELSVRLDRLQSDEQALVEELRRRQGFALSARLPGGERDLGGPEIEERHLRTVLERASRSSVHTVLGQMQNGFVTLRGGHRLGLCGTVSRRDGEILSLRHISSLALRLARPVRGIADGLLPALVEGGKFCSTLVIGPPGAGKTTLLRELIRVLSDELGLRVGVADERGELAALWQGRAQFYLGRHTDVLDGCTKEEGLGILLRGMAPQVLAVDEITEEPDVRAIRRAVGCGAELLASAHGETGRDLERRPVYRMLMREKVFRRLVIVENRSGVRICRTEVLA